jgi:NarL family two-component system response regulator YdfI
MNSGQLNRRRASGYLLKDTDRETPLDTIHAAAKGETLLKPEILKRILGLKTIPDRPERFEDDDTLLTDREREVLLAASYGDRNKEIAFKLGISERTVKAHLTSIYNKFGVDSRAAAVATASQKELLGSGD